MRAPILLIGICLLIWGWQHETLWIAVPLALAAEIAPLIKTRFDITRKELNIIFDMSAIFFAGLLVYGIVSESGSQAIFLLIFWLPIVLFPMILVQHYSSQWQQIPLTAISLKARKANQLNKSVDISFLYIAATLISASSSQTTPTFFYIALTAVFFISIWRLRGRFFPAWALIVCFPLAATGGFIIDKGIVNTQLYLEEHLGRLFLDWFNKNSDPFSRDTRLGSIGSLKGSGKIIYRLETLDNQRPPELIRDGSFDILLGNNWSASEIVFSRARTSNMTDWSLATTPNSESYNKPVTSTVKISSYFDNNAIIATPIGTRLISNIPAEKLEFTKLGTIKASEIPEMLVYETEYSRGGEYKYPPKSHDLHIPEHYKKYLEGIAATLQLAPLPPKQQLAKLHRYFLNNFSYTLDLDTNSSKIPPIIDFMINTKSGHCEYFASATVLMLRQIGIPARYATGFSIQEYDPFEQAWLAREYHAHAWALAYIDGRWINVDNTPPDWLSDDKEEDGIILSIYNAMSWARYAFNKWRMGNQEAIPDSYIYTLAIIFGLIIAYRIRKRRQRGDTLVALNSDVEISTNPWEVFFASIESITFEREEYETLLDWFARCSPLLKDTQHKKLREVIVYYYRYRFDPSADKASLEQNISSLIEKF